MISYVILIKKLYTMNIVPVTPPDCQVVLPDAEDYLII